MALYEIGPVGITGLGQQVVFQAAGDRQVPIRYYLLINRDNTNPLYLASDEQQPGGGPPDMRTPNMRSVSLLNALETITVGSDVNWWAVSPTGAPVQLQVTEVSTGWSASPVEIAIQVSAAGIPPTDNPQPLNNSPVFNQTIAAGATFTSPRMTIKQYQSWFGKMFATATSSGTGTNPYCQFELQWSVASDGFDPLRIEDWTIPNTPFNFTYNYVNEMQGLVIGDTLTLLVTNYDSQPVNLTYGLFGSFRTRLRSLFRGNYFAVPSPATGIGTDDVLYAASASGIPNANVPGAALMNLWEGPATVSGIFNIGNVPTGPVVAIITPQPIVGTGVLSGIPQFEIPGTTIGQNIYIPPTEVILPRRVCTFGIQNNSGFATAGGSVLVTAQVQPE